MKCPKCGAPLKTKGSVNNSDGHQETYCSRCGFNRHVKRVSKGYDFPIEAEGGKK